MTPGTSENHRVPPDVDNRQFLRNYLAPRYRYPNPLKFQSSRKFCRIFVKLLLNKLSPIKTSKKFAEIASNCPKLAKVAKTTKIAANCAPQFSSIFINFHQFSPIFTNFSKHFLSKSKSRFPC